MSSMNTIEYKHLKEGDTITCEAGSYADFRVGQRCKVLKDDKGLYLLDWEERKIYLYEMFKHLVNDPEAVYCMSKGGFIFYKKIEKDTNKPVMFTDIRKSTPNDFTEDELKKLYSGIGELSKQIKLERNKSKIKVGEVWKYRPKEFQIVGVEEGDEGIESILIEDTKNSEYLQWVDMPDFLEHYEPCNPPDIVIHVDADKVNKFCK